jgi:hypothetical protein
MAAADAAARHEALFRHFPALVAQHPEPRADRRRKAAAHLSTFA